MEAGVANNMKARDKNNNLVELVEKMNSYQLKAGETIATTVFSNGDLVRTYQKSSDVIIADVPNSIRNAYIFIAKINGVIAMACTVVNGAYDIYMITYVNTTVMFYKLTSTRVS